MGLFEEKMKRARGVVAQVEEAAIADFDKVIARGEELHVKRAKATTAHLVKLDSMHAALDGFEKSITEYSNNAPPLGDGEQSAKPTSAGQAVIAGPPAKAWEPARTKISNTG
jgi:hypothetical protein